MRIADALPARLVVVDPSGVETFSADLPSVSVTALDPLGERNVEGKPPAHSLAWSPGGGLIVIDDHDCDVGGAAHPSRPSSISRTEP